LAAVCTVTARDAHLKNNIELIRLLRLFAGIHKHQRISDGQKNFWRGDEQRELTPDVRALKEKS